MPMLAVPGQSRTNTQSDPWSPTFTTDELKELRHSKVQLAPGYSHITWMNNMKQLPCTQFRAISRSELQRHNTLDDMWMCIRGKIYNVTPYIPYHPGGSDILLKGAGCDATQLYNAIHSFVNVDALLSNCCIGILQ